ncbi:unnamed protein product [Adineta steineri]|uniref:NAD(P)(+)--arginine ADP-ribosyltransferase n=1 Tax=Adineta steineri TaxID=433720 RepID=A0A815NUJ8_9BILA|nr:unnamed protein product [Adineta steineri]CAF4029864.1 unnamed protein product [Adineta steineri]
MNRFVESEFDTKVLPPLCGYWSEKLVTLEQALKLIMPRIEELNRSIKAAKKHCHFPSEHGLSHDESAALYLYTMEGGEQSFYRVLNQALRNEDRPSLKPWFPYLKLLDTALNKLPTVNKNVWRGVVGDIGHDLKKNDKLTWWNVSSCSLSLDVIKDYLSTEIRSTLFLIEAKQAKDISRYTNYPDESEVLLGPGIQLRVVANAMNLSNGLNIIHLAEIVDDDTEILSSTSSTNYLESETPAEKGRFKLRRHQHRSHVLY